MIENESIKEVIDFNPTILKFIEDYAKEAGMEFDEALIHFVDLFTEIRKRIN